MQLDCVTVYHSCMDKTRIKSDLEEIAAYQRNLPTVRAEAVAAARAAGMTWREIASILGMTEHGVIKAHKAFNAK